MSEDDVGVIQFTPLLYMQRYSKVLEILEKHKPKKVVDFGCAECKLIQLLKGEEYIEEICGVDLDRTVLDGHKRRIEPLACNFINPRTLPLTVTLLHGSVLSPTDALKGFNAVTCIELIEHLHLSEVSKFKENVFGFIEPQLVVISTPNADFNVLFGNGCKLRHWDHKFEWSRPEFKTWCDKVCVKYPYTVEYDGVGMAPEGKQKVGFCTQFAIFHRSGKERSYTKQCDVIPYLYDTVAVSIHPYRSAKYKDESKLYLQFCSYIEAVLNACITALRNHCVKTYVPKHCYKNVFERCCSDTATPNGYKFSTSKRFVTNANFPVHPEQFADADGAQAESGLNGTNLYGQKRYHLRIEPLKSVYAYLKKLKDLYITEFSPTEQFEDCENDFSVLKNDDFFVDLSQYDNQLSYRVRFTDTAISDDHCSDEQITVYTTSNLIKLPFKFLSEAEEFKDLIEDASKITQLIHANRPDGVELINDDKTTFLLVDMEVSKVYHRHSRYPSVSSDSSSQLTDSSLPELKVCSESDFSEENWD